MLCMGWSLVYSGDEFKANSPVMDCHGIGTGSSPCQSVFNPGQSIADFRSIQGPGAIQCRNINWHSGGLAQLMPIGGQSVASYVCNHRTSPLCGSLLVYSEDEFKAQMVSEWIIRPSFNSGQSMSIVANPMPIPCQSVHLI